MNCASIIAHEKIHWRQQCEMLIVPFYLWYGAEWLIRRFIIGDLRAYYNLSFEREAYSNEKDINYLFGRKRFAWTGYLGGK